MIAINIPGFKELRLKHLVLDYNGTIAAHGRLIPGVPEKLAVLSLRLAIHILTADTFGTVREQLPPEPARRQDNPETVKIRSKAAIIREVAPAKDVLTINQEGT